MAKDGSLDLGWAPVRYRTFAAGEAGEYRVVVDGDAPVAVMWTNYDDAAGIQWLRQTDTVVEIHKMMLTGAAAGMPAWQAYAAAESRFSDSLRDAQAGTLDGLYDVMNGMADEMGDN